MDAEKMLPAGLMRNAGTGHSSWGVIAASESNPKTHSAEGRGYGEVGQVWEELRGAFSQSIKILRHNFSVQKRLGKASPWSRSI